MDLFLAGGISGNLNPYWRKFDEQKRADEAMRIFLAGCNGRENIVEESMKLFDGKKGNAPIILESYYYANKQTERLLPYFKDFLCDSGAFTFMQNSKTRIDWDNYINNYAEFINRNNISKYFELDIDSVVGYEKVLRYRERLKSLTGKDPIPVWHVSRGMAEFRKMCDDYSYVAIGGIVSKEIRKEQYKILPLMIKEAHKRGAKIHGLGFTVLSELPKCHFDSVDSTSWTSGNRFGHIWQFDGKTMVKIDAPKGKKLADPRLVAVHNFSEWAKFQKYADKHL